MARRKDSKAQVASGIAGLTIFVAWPVLYSIEQFTMLFEGNSAVLIIATLLVCATLAAITGNIAYRLLETIEDLF